MEGGFEAMMIITRGGIIPGGLLAEAMDITHILTAAVDFPAQMGKTGLYAWPLFIQFPEDQLLRERRTLVVDDVWGSGRTITSVKNRVVAAGGYRRIYHLSVGDRSRDRSSSFGIASQALILIHKIYASAK